MPLYDKAETLYPGITNMHILKTLLEAISNAGMWGNMLDPNKVIITEWNFGTAGFVFTVYDEGEGFDFKEKIRLFKANEKYAKRHGGGFLYYAMDQFEVGFEEEGRKVNIMVKYK